MDDTEILDELINDDNIITNQMGGAGADPFYDQVKQQYGTEHPEYHIGDQEMQKDILEIFNEEINKAVINIKKRLGDNIEDTNEKSAIIMQKLNELKDAVNPTVEMLKRNNETHVKLKPQNKYPNLLNTNIGDSYVDYGNPKDTKYTGSTFDEFKNKNTGYLADARKLLENLDSDTGINLEKKTDKDIEDSNQVPIAIKHEDGEDGIKFGRPKNNKDIQTRLNNCHILEMLYLIKHEEIMKTFAFTMNLFDKYKYSVKLLLFVLKNLVIKKPGIDVRLPKTLIPNIQTLLLDQEKVQEVIKTMKDNLEQNPLGGIQGAEVLQPDSDTTEDQLNANLGATVTPARVNLPRGAAAVGP